MIVSYADYIASPAWRAKADAAKRRAGWECTLCRSTRQLEAHHRSYTRLGDERPEDLIVLCGGCHRRHHARAQQLILPFVTLPDAP